MIARFFHLHLRPRPRPHRIGFACTDTNLWLTIDGRVTCTCKETT